jgi:hypothetical protein
VIAPILSEAEPARGRSDTIAHGIPRDGFPAARTELRLIEGNLGRGSQSRKIASAIAKLLQQ